MSSEQNNRPSAPPLCANNCGFYGNPTNKNLCSKCYREFVQKEAREAGATLAQVKAPLQQQQPTHGTSSVAAGSASVAVEGATVVADTTTSTSSAASAPGEAATSTSEPATSPSPLSSHCNSSSSTAATQAATGSGSSPLSPLSDSPVGQQPARGGNELTSSTPGVAAATTASPVSQLPPSTERGSVSEKTTSSSSSTSSPSSSCSGTTGQPDSLTASGASETPERKKQENTSRCWKCSKRVGLLGFQCRCGYFYCGDHRYADTHDCDFDYKSFEREQLRRQNNKVVAQKLEKL